MSHSYDFFRGKRKGKHAENSALDLANVEPEKCTECHSKLPTDK
jgi:hypothetical protein